MSKKTTTKARKEKGFTPTAEQLKAVGEQAKNALVTVNVTDLKVGKTLYKVIAENDFGLYLDSTKAIDSYFDSIKNQLVLDENGNTIALRDSIFKGFKVVRKTDEKLIVDYVYSVSEHTPVEKVVLHKDGTTDKKVVKGEKITEGYAPEEICDCIKWTVAGDKGIANLGCLFQENRKTTIPAIFCTASAYREYQKAVNELLTELEKQQGGNDKGGNE